jgi:hypothetical protein
MMRTESHRHRTQSRSNNVRNDLALLQNYRERPGPKLVGQSADQLSIPGWHIHNSLKRLPIRQVNNERIEARPFLCFKNFCDGNRIERVARESVNGFRRQRDKVALPQQFNRRSAVG